MKGLELPINVLVVVAVAVIVLLGVVGLFFAGFIGGSSAISLTAAKNNACAQLISSGCGTTRAEDIPVNYDVDSDGLVEPFDENEGTPDNLLALCQTKFGAATELECKRQVCACPI